MISRIEFDRRLVVTLRFVFAIAGVALLAYCMTSFASEQFDFDSKIWRHRTSELLLLYVVTNLFVTLAFTLGKLDSNYTRFDRAVVGASTVLGGLATIAFTFLLFWA